MTNVESHVIIGYKDDGDEIFEIYEISFYTLKLFFSDMLLSCYFIVLILFN